MNSIESFLIDYTSCLYLSFSRDLKPENILLNKDMHIQITDFGTAKIFESDEDGKPLKNDIIPSHCLLPSTYTM